MFLGFRSSWYKGVVVWVVKIFLIMMIFNWTFLLYLRILHHPQMHGHVTWLKLRNTGSKLVMKMEKPDLLLNNLYTQYYGTVNIYTCICVMFYSPSSLYFSLNGIWVFCIFVFIDKISSVHLLFEFSVNVL